MNNIKEIKKMKMKNAALRALYGALTLSLIILGGCDQPTSSNNNNNNDPEQDLWHTLLDADGTESWWTKNIDGVIISAQKICFTPDRRAGIKYAGASDFAIWYSNCAFDGKVITSKGSIGQKIIITNFKTLTGGRQFTLDASQAPYIYNRDSDFSGDFRS
jgi:hypothetical protein